MASAVPLPDMAELSDEDLREQLEAYGVNVGPIVSTTRLFYEKKLGRMMEHGVSPPHSREDTEESEGDYEDDEEVVMEEEVQFNFKQPVMQEPEPSHPEPQFMPSRPEPQVMPSRPEPQFMPSRPEPQVMPSRPEPQFMPSRPEPQVMPSRPPPVARKPESPYTPIIQQRRGSPTRATSARHRPGAARQPPTTQTVDNGGDAKSGGKGGGIAMWIKLLFIVIVAFLVYLVIINMNPTTQNKIPMSIDDF